MAQDNLDIRNFLFFLNYIKSLTFEDSLIGALAVPSTWSDVADMVKTARKKSVFVRAINKAQLYVHVPFCGRICTFCDCAKVLLRQRSDIDAYIKALTNQMMLLAPLYQGMDPDSMCFGGGTPSILDERQLTMILDGADKAFPSRGRRIIIEINPSSWTPSKLAILAGRGLFRLSVGVQSLDEKVLKNVSRSQTRQKVLWCLRSARKAGVPHVNVDLIAGLPGQTIDGFLEDLKIVVAEGASIVHIYPYCGSSPKELCALGETVPEFFKRRDAMMKAAKQVMIAEGFCRKGHEAYTRNGEGEEDQEEVYLRLEAAVAAFGPSAQGQIPGAVFYSVGSSNVTKEFTRVDACSQDLGYVMSHYAVFAIFNGLNENIFMKRFGVSLDEHCGEGLRYLRRSGLISLSKGVWRYSGKWEIYQLYEFASLSRILFGEDILLRLRNRYLNQYDPKQDYSKGNSLLKTYANSWLMSLYYQLGY